MKGIPWLGLTTFSTRFIHWTLYCLLCQEFSSVQLSKAEQNVTPQEPGHLIQKQFQNPGLSLAWGPLRLSDLHPDHALWFHCLSQLCHSFWVPLAPSQKPFSWIRYCSQLTHRDSPVSLRVCSKGAWSVPLLWKHRAWLADSPRKPMRQHEGVPASVKQREDFQSPTKDSYSLPWVLSLHCGHKALNLAQLHSHRQW